MNFQNHPHTEEERAYMHKLYTRDGKLLGERAGRNLYYASMFGAEASAQRLGMLRYLKEACYDRRQPRL